MNQFVKNTDGTVTDKATGLMWQSTDDGKRRNWQDSLAYAENAEYAGHSDWRLPSIKELQSIVQYGKPVGEWPAIDTLLYLIWRQYYPRSHLGLVKYHTRRL
ncbi:DUF1566 domain-containing protein [Psychromonas sp. KJ10-2]|uniref:Lcl C-terminal domain-containing protein n=1 Tax=Psychromonas sp. KJ10-2 TaxID=3391822 RepID=UPI0039B56372